LPLVRPGRPAALLLWVFGGQVAYSVYVGGDAWEWWGGSNRYLSIAMPAFFTLLGGAFAALLRTAGLRWGARRVAAACGLVLLLYASVGVGEARWVMVDLLRTGGINLLLALLLASGLMVARAAPPAAAPAGVSLTARHVHYGVAALVAISLVNTNAIYGVGALKEWLLLAPSLHAENNQTLVERALWLRRVTGPRAALAVTWAGALPYFVERPAIDLLGKSDRYVARRPMRRDLRVEPNVSTGLSRWLMFLGLNRFNQFYPGHLKWDYAYSIGELRPDVVVQLWRAREEAAPILHAYYVPVRLGRYLFHMRKDSGEVRWDEVRRLAALMNRGGPVPVVDE